MNTDLYRARSRQMVIFLLVCGGMLILLGRLYYWQIIQSNRLSSLASSEHIQNQIVNAPRGLIYDATGHILATNVIRDDVYIEPLQFASDHTENYQADLDLQVRTLHTILPGLSETKLRDYFHLNYATVRIAQQIDPSQSQKLRDAHLPDTFLEPRTWRVYPNGELAAQLLGYVQNGQGIYGLEARFNKLLSGKAGNFVAETDLNGNPLTVGASSGEDAVKGADLTLTIDDVVQYQVQQELASQVQSMDAQGGAAVILNAHTGAVVALAGYPTFDPNHYSDFADQTGCLKQQEVYFSPVLYCDYEPGSTMKTITMAAALDQHLITPDTAIDDPGTLSFPDGTPAVANCCGANVEAYGHETMTEVLEHSANVGAAYVAYFKLGPDHYYPYLQRFGFGQKTGLFEPESPGDYRSPGSSNWTKSDLTRQSFGQSIRVTPLQVAQAYQALANDGVLMHPYIVSSTNDNGHVTATALKAGSRIVSSEAAKQITSMLISTSHYTKITVPGYSVAIKTGTATTQGLSNDLTEASVAGFLPASNPQFVVLVKVDQPRKSIYGGGAAGPLWMNIAQQLMLHYGVSPDQPV